MNPQSEGRFGGLTPNSSPTFGSAIALARTERRPEFSNNLTRLLAEDAAVVRHIRTTDRQPDAAPSVTERRSHLMATIFRRPTSPLRSSGPKPWDLGPCATSRGEATFARAKAFRRTRNDLVKGQ
jgi:hypothetical protein